MLGVVLKSPAGEDGSPSGHILVDAFGHAWGDKAEGTVDKGLVVGTWNVTNPAVVTSSLGGTWDQIFLPVNPNPDNFTTHVEMQHVQTGKTISFPKYGFYCTYDDDDHHVELFLDVNYKVLASHAVIGGVEQVCLIEREKQSENKS